MFIPEFEVPERAEQSEYELDGVSLAVYVQREVILRLLVLAIRPVRKRERDLSFLANGGSPLNSNVRIRVPYRVRAEHHR